MLEATFLAFRKVGGHQPELFKKTQPGHGEILSTCCFASPSRRYMHTFELDTVTVRRFHINIQTMEKQSETAPISGEPGLTISYLPFDINVTLMKKLDPKSRYNLGLTCKNLQNTYSAREHWKDLIKTTFPKIPRHLHSPPKSFLVEVDPEWLHHSVLSKESRTSWYELYQDLTKSKLYTWGTSKHRCLGRDQKRREGVSHSPILSDHLSQRSIRPITDVQCGEYNVCVLSQHGAAYLTGVIDGSRQVHNMMWRSPSSDELRIRVGTSENHESGVLREISVGANHILGLAQDRTIWSWYDAKRSAVCITLPKNYSEKAISVCAGWNISSAYIQGYGIVLWETVRTDTSPTEFVLIPETEDDKFFDPEFQYQGKMKKWIVLRRYIVIRGSDQRLRIASIDLANVSTPHIVDKFIHSDKVEMLLVDSDNTEENPGISFDRAPHECHAQNVSQLHGSYWPTFAVTLEKNRVLEETFILSEDHIDGAVAQATMSQTTFDPQPSNPGGVGESLNLAALRFPALQQEFDSLVMQLCFGEQHFLAIHADGSITSYGSERRSRRGFTGACGLGDNKPARGFDARNRSLQPHSCFIGRKVLFDNSMKDWLHFFGRDPSLSKAERRAMGAWKRSPELRGEVSNWVEGQLDHVRWYQVGEQLPEWKAAGALLVAAGKHHSAAIMVPPRMGNKPLESIPDRPTEYPPLNPPSQVAQYSPNTSGESTRILRRVDGAQGVFGIPNWELDVPGNWR